MLLHTLITFTIPLCIYSVMGIVVARILLNPVNPRHFNWLEWLQFTVDALRIVFLWPLVLFIEKTKSWLETSAGLHDPSPVNPIASTNSKETA